jgi:hypothetical protein
MVGKVRGKCQRADFALDMPLILLVMLHGILVAEELTTRANDSSTLPELMVAEVMSGRECCRAETYEFG